jgi:hypothetical protein
MGGENRTGVFVSVKCNWVGKLAKETKGEEEVKGRLRLLRGYKSKF